MLCILNVFRMCFRYVLTLACVLNMFSMYGGGPTSQDLMVNAFSQVFLMCCGCVLKVFSMCLVWLKIKSHFFAEKQMLSKTGELIGNHVFCAVLH